MKIFFAKKHQAIHPFSIENILNRCREEAIMAVMVVLHGSLFILFTM